MSIKPQAASASCNVATRQWQKFYHQLMFYFICIKHEFFLTLFSNIFIYIVGIYVRGPITVTLPEGEAWCLGGLTHHHHTTRGRGLVLGWADPSPSHCQRERPGAWVG